MPSCGEQLVKLLEDYGIDTVFGIPGVHTVELYRGLATSGIRHVTPRHEQGAGFMADGYARANGKPAACFIITGPGITNISTAMAQAYRDSIPMLVISSVNKRHQLGMGEGVLHELPSQQAVIAGLTVFSHTVLSIEQLPKVLARAFGIFSSQRPGPVHIELPIDVINQTADDLDTIAYPLPVKPSANPAQLVQAADLLRNASRPLIAIGGGAINASSELITLAEQLDAPVINTVNAKGVIPIEHPLSVGGSASASVIRDEMKQSDVVIAAGTEFGETDYDYFYSDPLEIGGSLIRIDIDPAQLSRNLKPDLAICSDSAMALAGISHALGKIRPAGKGIERTQALRAGLDPYRNGKYDAFFKAITDALPGVIIAGDSTQPTYYAWLNYETSAPRHYFHSASGYGTLGYAIPAAIGARLSKPGSPVVALIGDGAAQFSIGELATAAEEALNVIFIIWNNNGYAEIGRFMDEADVIRVGVDLYTPDFLQIAQGFGCATSRPPTIDAFSQELIKAHHRNHPTVIEIVEENFVDGYPYP